MTRAAVVTIVSLLLAGCWWQQPGAGPGNTRYVPLENHLTPDNVAGLTELWSVDIPGGTAEPVTSGQLLYVGGSPSSEQTVTALDIATGTTAWQRPLPTAVKTGTMPIAFSRDELWVSQVARFPFINPLCADITRLDPATGEVIGTEAVDLPTTAFVTAGPIVAYIDSLRCSSGGNARLVVRDRDTSAVLWTAPLDGFERSSEPIISDGKIYAGGRVFSADGCGAAVCDPLPIDADLAMATGGRIFDFDNFSIHEPPPDPVLEDWGVVVVSDAGTGQDLWRDSHGAYMGPRGGVSSMAVGDETVFITAWLQEGAALVGRLASYPAAGCGAALCDPTWMAPAPVHTGPLAVAGDVVYAVSDNGSDDRLLAYDADGCEAATCAALLDLPLSVNPDDVIVSAGHVFVMTTTGLGTPDVATTITTFGLP